MIILIAPIVKDCMGSCMGKKEIREIFKTSRIFNGFCGVEGSRIELFIPLLTFLDEIDNPLGLQKFQGHVNTDHSNVEDKMLKPIKARKRGRRI